MAETEVATPPPVPTEENLAKDVTDKREGKPERPKREPEEIPDMTVEEAQKALNALPKVCYSRCACLTLCVCVSLWVCSKNISLAEWDADACDVSVFFPSRVNLKRWVCFAVCCPVLMCWLRRSVFGFCGPREKKQKQQKKTVGLC